MRLLRIAVIVVVFIIAVMVAFTFELFVLLFMRG